MSRSSRMDGLAELAADETPVARRRFQYGSGMLVGVKRGKGEVLTAGSCGWIMGLTRGDPFTEQTTRNALESLHGGLNLP